MNLSEFTLFIGLPITAGLVIGLYIIIITSEIKRKRELQEVQIR